MKNIALTILAILVISCGSAFATPIPLTSITASASSELSFSNEEFTIIDSASNTIDGILTLENWWRMDWQTDGDPWIAWEFDDIYILNSMQVANYFEDGQMNRAMKNVDIYIKQGEWVYLKTVTLNKFNAWDSLSFNNTISLDGVSCTGVMFDPQDNYYAPTYWTPPFPITPGDPDALTGLMEVAFDGSLDPGPFTCGDMFHPYPPFDLNNDCVVDVNDMALFADSWLLDARPW